VPQRKQQKTASGGVRKALLRQRKPRRPNPPLYSRESRELLLALAKAKDARLPGAFSFFPLTLHPSNSLPSSLSLLHVHTTHSPL
jgi:hypothetical protein